MPVKFRIHHSSFRIQQRGSVLLLSLLVLSSVLLTTAGIIDLVLQTLGNARVADQGIVGYYAAESAIEHALFAMRKDGASPASLSPGDSLGNGSAWSRSITSPRVIYTTLSDTAWVPLDLYDPDDIGVAADVGSVRISWDGPQGSVLLVDYVALPTAGSPVWADNVTHVRLPWVAGGVTVSLDPTSSYRMRLISEAGVLANVRMTTHDSTGAQIPIPFARVQITATGSYGLARQALQLTIPRNDFLSGIFKDLIWSDCSVVKNKPRACP